MDGFDFAAQIREAIDEAYKAGQDYFRHTFFGVKLDEAKAEAYEDAAKIAHQVAEDELEMAREYKDGKRPDYRAAKI